jgi:hypothetical protein
MRAVAVFLRVCCKTASTCSHLRLPFKFFLNSCSDTIRSTRHSVVSHYEQHKQLV